MKPTALPNPPYPTSQQEEKAKLNITARMSVNVNADYTSSGNGLRYGNWKIEPFVAFKVTMDDGSIILLTSPKDFERFGIKFFEHEEVELEPCEFQ